MNRSDGLLLFGREPAGITRHEGSVILLKKGGEFHDHRLLRSTCRVLTKRLITVSDAASVVGVSCA